uniref:teashirt homolog 3-like n=1 Tax=Myxine glutinosa TaxID=7769 RepID=UPI00358F31FD
MPRRKQQAPRRLAAYLSEDELKTTEDEQADGEDEQSDDAQEGDGAFPCQELLESEVNCDDERRFCSRNPAKETRKTGVQDESDMEGRAEANADGKKAIARHDGRRSSPHDVDSESQASEGSDSMLNYNNGSVRDEEHKDEKAAVGINPESLVQMKAAYARLLAYPYWSSTVYGLSALGLDDGEKIGNGSGCSVNSAVSGAGQLNWHQAALAKTLQQQTVSHGPTTGVMDAEPGLFSTVQLHRQSGRLYGTVFTGASKFRCRDCSSAYETLVELTMHMSDTGHYRDDNQERESEGSKRWSKPRKRSLLEMEGKEDAQKVLKCMYCGYSFDSLQDLSVHMIKTKHYQKVPLKEPLPSLISTKMTPNVKKRSLPDNAGSNSPESRAVATVSLPSNAYPPQKSSGSGSSSSHYGHANNRFGYQNGASYAWQFETKKAQILKCMECGSSHDTLEQLTAHMMVTGHFVKVTNSSAKKGKFVAPGIVLEQKGQSVPLPPSNVGTRCSPNSTPSNPISSMSILPSKPMTTFSTAVPENHKSPSSLSSSSAFALCFKGCQPRPPLSCVSGSPAKPALSPSGSSNHSFASLPNSPGQIPLSPVLSFDKQAEKESRIEEKDQKSDAERESKIMVDVKEEEENDTEYADESDEKARKDLASQYLREEDLEATPTAGLDILKSLENTVASAINKAQNGTPSWGGYQSIHAAYQLPAMMKLVNQSAAQEMPLKAAYGASAKPSAAKILSSTPVAHSCSLTPPPCSPSPKNNVHAMEELVKKVSENLAKVEEKGKRSGANKPVACSSSEASSPCRSEDGHDTLGNGAASSKGHSAVMATPLDKMFNGNSKSQRTLNGLGSQKGSGALGRTNWLSIITDHGTDASVVNPLSMLQSVMNIHLGKAAKAPSVAADPMAMLYKMSGSLPEKGATSTPPLPRHTSSETPESSLYRSSPDQPIDLTKSKRGPSEGGAQLASVRESNRPPSVGGDSALSDMSDMVRSLTGGKSTPKPPTPASTTSERSETDTSVQEDAEELSPTQRRKGRQSTWNPQHLLLLQAQFVASLRASNDGRYSVADVGPQERTHVSRFTGLNMTTISHWLANVKYQLRKTGGTKFLKQMDTGQPVFHCNDCASQFRTPAMYISHLEGHLGFRLRDLARFGVDRHGNALRGPTVSDGHEMDEAVTVTGLRCRLCGRTFAGRHAVKLHLSKAHGKSPEDHLLFVTETETL